MKYFIKWLNSLQGRIVEYSELLEKKTFWIDKDTIELAETFIFDKTIEEEVVISIDDIINKWDELGLDKTEWNLVIS